MIQAIEERRSIRKFSDREISEEDLREILESGIKAPSSKNRQPWKFIVLRKNAKREMVAIFKKGIEREEKGAALLPESRMHLAGARYTVQIAAQAPVVILAVNTLGKGPLADLTAEESVYQICNIQSVSAAIENMLLAAAQKRIGSLWICDTYFAYEELNQWKGTPGDLIAAIALGYPEEAPGPRPRKTLEDVVEWRE